MSAPSEQLPAEPVVALDERAALDRELAPLRTLQDVITWGFAQTPPCEIADIVVQDEYCQDVITAGPRHGAIQLYLCFDTT
jgi:hypothetical protein